MNINNLSQKTNFVAGSSELELVSFYLTTVNIPGINFSHVEVGSRSGARFNVSGDTITYNPLSFEMLIDEDFNIYHEFMSKITDSINPEAGSYANKDFDFWIEINNNKGVKLFKIEFYNCKIETIGDISLETQNDMTEHTMSVEIKYDYYKIIRSEIVPTLAV